MTARHLPTGTVTFLLTDIAASTQAWETEREAMARVVARHYEILDDAVHAHRGVRPVEQGEGDSVVAAFARASDALRASVAAQLALQAEPWPTGAAPLVRMAVHTGEVALRDEGNYFGPAIIRCARLRAVAHGGQIVCSRATADLAVDDLPADVGLLDLGSHRLKDLGRPEQVFEVTNPKLPGGFPPLRSLDVVPNNLPAQLTSFVGRERELVEIRRLLDGHRLVTLTGSGGCGKTRLAAALAAELAGEYPDGAWWIELAPIADGVRVVGDVLSALRVPEAPGRPPLQHLSAYLAPRSLLLVLDNCEHLLAECAALADALLHGCPGVRLLATSRERLDLPGELAWRVPPMGLPAAPDTGEIGPRELAALDSYDAVALFVARAVTARPNFTVTNEIAPAVAQLCARLDGIPLAIELAAARTRVMTVAEILAGMSDRFRLLTGGSRNLMMRQQTLEASVAWSHDLLATDERALLRRLSVFAGGFTLSAVEAVCAAEDLPSLRVLDLLESLLAKSLVVLDAEQAQTSRFRLLETVRAFAARKLDEAGEAGRVRDEHLRHYLELATGAEAALLHLTRATIERVSVDVDNYRAALEWALTADDPEPALRLARHLGFVQTSGGRHTEAREWTSRALACSGGTAAARGWVHWVAGSARFSQGDIAGVVASAEAVLHCADEAGDDMLRGRGLHLRWCHQAFTDPPAVRASVDEGAALAERSGDLYLQFFAPSIYIVDELRNDNLEQAQYWVDRQRRLSREHGNDQALNWCLLAAAHLATADRERQSRRCRRDRPRRGGDRHPRGRCHPAGGRRRGGARPPGRRRRRPRRRRGPAPSRVGTATRPPPPGAGPRGTGSAGCLRRRRGELGRSRPASRRRRRPVGALRRGPRPADPRRGRPRRGRRPGRPRCRGIRRRVGRRRQAQRRRGGRLRDPRPRRTRSSVLRLGQPHPNRTRRGATGRQGRQQRRDWQAVVHRRQHREGPPLAHLRQTRPGQPRRTRRRGDAARRITLCMAETGAALTRHRNARECSRRGRGFAVEFDLGQIDHLLSTTRAVRRRLDLDRPVPDDLLLRCIDLAEQAPSGGNQTARRWLVVKDPTVKAELADLYRAVGVPYLRSLAALVEGTRGAEPAVMDSSLYLAENLHRVPALVVVAIEGVHNGPPTHPGLYGDVLQAAWSFCLAARSRGLGTAWTTLHLNRAAETAQLLGIPDGVTQVALFPVGWTTGDDFKPVARRPAAEITYFDQWGLTQTPAADGAGPAHRPSVTVDAKIAADLQVVWDLLLDLPGAGVVASEWDEQLPARAATADVATCDPRRAFAWRSADARTRAAHWQFRMEPTVVVSANPRPGTLLVYRATLRSTPEGPGDGGAIRRQLRDEMRRTLRAIQDRAERAAASM